MNVRPCSWRCCCTGGECTVYLRCHRARRNMPVTADSASPPKVCLVIRDTDLSTCRRQQKSLQVKLLNFFHVYTFISGALHLPSLHCRSLCVLFRRLFWRCNLVSLPGSHKSAVDKDLAVPVRLPDAARQTWHKSGIWHHQIQN